ncbi:Arginine/serine-rich splicing factor scl25a transcript I [Orobanche gracilis]
MRGRSYTPSPPRGYGRRGRSPAPRGRHSRGDAPTSLLVRNLRRDIRPEDLKRPFGQFGPVKDVYLPRDYHSGEPRGFGFIQYVDPSDAAEAKYQMDGQILQGREITVVFAEENRKKPTEMRARERGGGRGRAYDRRRSPPRYSRSPPRYGRSPSRSRDYYSPPKRRYSRVCLPAREKVQQREIILSLPGTGTFSTPLQQHEELQRKSREGKIASWFEKQKPESESDPTPFSC